MTHDEMHALDTRLGAKFGSGIYVFCCWTDGELIGKGQIYKWRSMPCTPAGDLIVDDLSALTPEEAFNQATAAVSSMMAGSSAARSLR